MSVQIIKDSSGRPEYVVLPIRVYEALSEQIKDELAGLESEADRSNDYEPFNPADYVQNPAALARLRAGAKQMDLARAMGVSQAYVSKLEHAERVTPKALERVHVALKALRAST